MRIKALRIENFRSIKHLDLELSDTTVLIGPNNSGKTAILDAIRIALTRRWGQRGTGFTEYDVHLATETDDPKASPGVAIELRAEELQPGEWPEGVPPSGSRTTEREPLDSLSSHRPAVRPRAPPVANSVGCRRAMRTSQCCARR